MYDNLDEDKELALALGRDGPGQLAVRTAGGKKNPIRERACCAMPVQKTLPALIEKAG
ncbi:MAG: hypothetical protein U5J63_13300 [Fodinibius sp.]|nr:hypothetical protein [Fodinibius sp.]